MGKLSIAPHQLAEAVERELTIYHEEINEKLRDVTREAMAELVKKTRASAPRGDRGKYHKYISGDFRGLARGSRSVRAVWYVKDPEYRLTHLLVHGHDLPNGGRTKADPFLHNALDEVLPKYEEAVKEAITK